MEEIAKKRMLTQRAAVNGLKKKATRKWVNNVDSIEESKLSWTAGSSPDGKPMGIPADMLQTWIKLWGKKKAVGLGGRNLEEQNQTTARSTTAWILGEWGREITGK
jgi:hypothetical protein